RRTPATRPAPRWPSRQNQPTRAGLNGGQAFNVENDQRAAACARLNCSLVPCAAEPSSHPIPEPYPDQTPEIERRARLLARRLAREKGVEIGGEVGDQTAPEVAGDARARELRQRALQAVFDREEHPRLPAIVLRLE